MKYLDHLALAIIAALALSFVGCAAADGNNDTDEQAQAATFAYGITDGWKTIPQLATRYCRAYNFFAKNGHAGAPTWPNGQYKEGATFDTFPASIGAVPYSVAAGGNATASTICEDFSNWSFGAAASQSDDNVPPYLLWGPASGQGPVGASIPLWNFPASFCYLNGMTGMSNVAEDVRVDPPAGWAGDWNLVVANGVPTIGGSAKCVYPDRAWTYYGPVVAQIGTTVQGPSYANSICAVQRVRGNLDGGPSAASATITKNTGAGKWQITATNVLAQMGCMVF